MVEMIVENNIKAFKDMEDLLACYLESQGKEYHDLIIKVFFQIWVEFIYICIEVRTCNIVRINYDQMR
ncbi:hypothetical protein ARALYDRAFT_892779 [Arabidopsis lyrata subsp. lyrata]|uniref:Transcription repressor n=1 Tax=Arabidopsis lyrata subsp. lyrata TaxID=81972 RepID=D7KAX8_ARALL|nr:hypothetical protein ARALYDRAFT_892779 [Arabidopsis lyrata subsp. lyrata]